MNQELAVSLSDPKREETEARLHSITLRYEDLSNDYLEMEQKYLRKIKELEYLIEMNRGANYNQLQIELQSQKSTVIVRKNIVHLFLSDKNIKEKIG